MSARASEYERETAKARGEVQPRRTKFMLVDLGFMRGEPVTTPEGETVILSGHARWVWQHMESLSAKARITRKKLAYYTGYSKWVVRKALLELRRAGLAHLFAIKVGKDFAGKDYVVSRTPITRKEAKKVFDFFYRSRSGCTAELPWDGLSVVPPYKSDRMGSLENMGVKESKGEEPPPPESSFLNKELRPLASTNTASSCETSTGKESTPVSLADVETFATGIEGFRHHVSAYRRDLLSFDTLPAIPAWDNTFATATAQDFLRKVAQADRRSRKPPLTPKALRSWLAANWEEIAAGHWMGAMWDGIGGWDALTAFRKEAPRADLEMRVIHVLRSLGEKYRLGISDPAVLVAPETVAAADAVWREVYTPVYPEGAPLKPKERQDLALLLVTRFDGDVAALRRAATHFIQTTDDIFLTKNQHAVYIFIKQVAEHMDQPNPPPAVDLVGRPNVLPVGNRVCDPAETPF